MESPEEIGGSTDVADAIKTRAKDKKKKKTKKKHVKPKHVSEKTSELVCLGEDTIESMDVTEEVANDYSLRVQREIERVNQDMHRGTSPSTWGRFYVQAESTHEGGEMGVDKVIRTGVGGLFGPPPPSDIAQFNHPCGEVTLSQGTQRRAYVPLSHPMTELASECAIQTRDSHVTLHDLEQAGVGDSNPLNIIKRLDKTGNHIRENARDIDPRAFADPDDTWITDTGTRMRSIFDSVTWHEIVANKTNAATAAGRGELVIPRVSTMEQMYKAYSRMTTTMLVPWEVVAMLFEPSVDVTVTRPGGKSVRIKERPCVRGEECAARKLLYHELGEEDPLTHGGPQSGYHGVILKEYLTDSQRLVFYTTGQYPDTHQPCLIDLLKDSTVSSILHTISYTANTPIFTCPVDCRGGYHSDMCSPAPVSSNGRQRVEPSFMPNFDVGNYIPTTLDVALKNNLVRASTHEIELLQYSVEHSSRPIRGYLEDSASMHYFPQTRWLSFLVRSNGSEPNMSYVQGYHCTTIPPGISPKSHHFIDVAECEAMRPASGTVNIFTWIDTTAARLTGYELTALHLLLGPIAIACVAVKYALLCASGQVELTTADVPPFLQFSPDPPRTLRAIVDIIKACEWWERFAPPVDLAAWSVYITTVVRMGIYTDVHYAVERTLTSITKIEHQTRVACERTLKRGRKGAASDVAVDVLFAGPTQRQNMLGVRINNANKTGENHGHTSIDSSLRAAKPYCLGDVLPLTDIDNINTVFSREHQSHTALLRWLVSTNTLMCTDDHIIGPTYTHMVTEILTADNDKLAMNLVIVALGDLSPDVLYSPIQRIDIENPSNGMTSQSSQSTQFESASKQQQQQQQPSKSEIIWNEVTQTIIPYVPNYVSTNIITYGLDTPKMAQVKFLSHRDNILMWLEPSSAKAHNRFKVAVDINTDLLDALIRINAINISVNGEETANWVAHQTSHPTHRIILGDLFRPFAELVQVLRMHPGVDVFLLRLLYSKIAMVVPASLMVTHPKMATELRPGRCSIAAATLCRAMVADLLIKCTVDAHVANRLHMFAATHFDMICGIEWTSDNMVTPDDTLLKECALHGPLATRTASLYMLNYPRDSRYNSSASTPPMATLLKHSGILEPPSTSSTHSSSIVAKETAPRACISRELFNVLVRTCNRDNATSTRIIRCVRDMLAGNIAHLSILPTTATCIEINQLCERASFETLLRIDCNIAIDVEKRLRSNLMSMVQFISKFDEGTEKAPEVIHRLLLFRDVCINVSSIFKAIHETMFDAPYRALGTIITNEIASALTIELYRNLISRASAIELGKRFCEPQDVLALDKQRAVDGVRVPPRHADILSVIEDVVATDLVKTRGVYHAAVSTCTQALAEYTQSGVIKTKCVFAIKLLERLSDTLDIEFTNTSQTRYVAILVALQKARKVASCVGLCGPKDVPNRRLAVKVCCREIKWACEAALILNRPSGGGGGGSGDNVMIPNHSTMIPIIENILENTMISGGPDIRSNVKTKLFGVLKAHVNWPSFVTTPDQLCERAAEDLITALGRFVVCGLLNEVFTLVTPDAALIVKYAPGIINMVSHLPATSTHAIGTVVHNGSRVGCALLSDMVRNGTINNWPAYGIFSAEICTILAEADIRSSTRLLNAIKSRPTNKVVTCATPDIRFDSAMILQQYDQLKDYHEMRNVTTDAEVTSYIAKLRGVFTATSEMDKGTSTATTTTTTTTPYFSIGPDHIRKIILLIVMDATEFSGIAMAYNNKVTELAHNTKIANMANTIVNQSDIARIRKTPSFIKTNYTLVDIAQRNMYVAALSRATSLCNVLTTHGNRFPVYMRYVLSSAHFFQTFFVKNRRLPTPKETSSGIKGILKVTGKDVFRIFREKCIVKIEKALSNFEILLRSEGFFLQHTSKRAKAIDVANRQFMWRVISTEYAAHRLEETPITPGHVISMLKTIGLPRRARAITVKLILTYEIHGGLYKLRNIVSTLRTTEIHLLLTFFSLLRIVTNTEYIPTRNRRDIESGINAIATRRDLTPGQPIPVHMTTLCVCPNCSTITSQVMTAGITPVDTSNQHGSAITEYGNVVCAEHKSVSERNITDIVKMGLGINDPSDDHPGMMATGDPGPMDDTLTAPAIEPDLVDLPLTTNPNAYDDDIIDPDALTKQPSRKKRKKHKSKKGTAQSMTIDGRPPARSPTEWHSPCTETIVQRHYLVGTMIRFAPQKATGLDEKQIAIKEPICLCPCCGLIGRFIGDHTDRYGSMLCPACAIGIGDPRYDAHTCCVCGEPLVASAARTLLELTATSKSRINPTVCVDLAGLACPIPSARNQDRFQTGLSRIGVPLVNRTLNPSKHASIRCAPNIPVASIDSNSIMLFDDTNIHHVYPAVLCEDHVNLPSVKAGVYPIRLTKLQAEARSQQVDFYRHQLAYGMSPFGPSVRGLLQTLFKSTIIH